MQAILVVDDDDELRTTISLGLEKNGFKVFQASNGPEATVIVATTSLDLILCDVNLEERNYGQAVVLLKKQAKASGTAFMLMTGYPGQQSLDVEVMLKPFTLSTLLRTIRRHLKKHHGMQSQPEPLAASRALNHSISNIAHFCDVKCVSADHPSPTVQQLEGVLARVESLREADRARISRTIHDDITQMLTVVAIELSFLENSLMVVPQKAAPAAHIVSVKKLVVLINKLIRSAQVITAEMRPKLLEEFGLVAALEWLTQQVQVKSGLKCKLAVAPNQEGTLDLNIASELYRLVEEILANVVRHDEATEVSILVANEPGRVCLQISDNGTSMRSEQAAYPDSLDLLAMQRRAARLGGTFKTTSNLGRGTTVIVCIPLVSGQLPGIHSLSQIDP